MKQPLGLALIVVAAVLAFVLLLGGLSHQAAPPTQPEPAPAPAVQPAPVQPAPQPQPRPKQPNRRPQPH